MVAFLQTNELLIVLAIALLVFGGAKLPKLARSLGQAQNEFKKGVAEDGPKDAADDAPKDASEDETTTKS